MVDSTQRAFIKTMDVMSCFGRSCDEHFRHYINPDEAKRAKQRDKEVTRILKDHHKQELKKLKILLLGKFSRSAKHRYKLFKIFVSLV